MSAQQTLEQLWAKPYFDGVPDDTYMALIKKFEQKMTDGGKAYWVMKSEIIDGDFDKQPLTTSIFFETEPGMNQIKGIIKRVDESLFNCTSVYQAMVELEKKLIGAVVQLRHVTSQNKETGKTYKNVYLHEVISFPNSIVTPDPTINF